MAAKQMQSNAPDVLADKQCTKFLLSGEPSRCLQSAHGWRASTGTRLTAHLLHLEGWIDGCRVQLGGGCHSTSPKSYFNRRQHATVTVMKSTCSMCASWRLLAPGKHLLLHPPAVCSTACLPSC